MNVDELNFKIDHLAEALGLFASKLTLEKGGQNVVYSPLQGSCKDIENCIKSELDIPRNTQNKRSEKRMAYLIDEQLKPEGTIRQRKDNGRWEIRYMDNGIQKSVSNKIQAKCLDLFDQRLKERNSRPKQPKPERQRFTLFMLLDKWHNDEVKSKVRLGKKREKNKISKSHSDRLKTAIELHIKKHFPDSYLDNLTVFVLEECSKKVEYSRTRENVDSVLNMSLNWAHKKGLMKNDIVRHFEKHKHEREQGKPFTRKDQERILEYAQKHSGYYFQFMVYFHTGCRPSEIREIKHCDFDFTNKTIFIDGTKTKTSSRKIPLFSPLFAFRDKINNTKDFVFKNGVETLRKELKSMLIALGIAAENEISNTDDDKTKYTLKSTRHSFATRLREKGIDIKTISIWLGHSNIQMTDNYSHVLSEFEQLQASKYDTTAA